MTAHVSVRFASFPTAIAPALAVILAGSALPAAADLPTEGTVQQLTAGDAACRVALIDGEGQPFSALATFDICRQNLIGQRVQLTYETANVLAAACQGDPDCGQTETVRVITQAAVIAPPSRGRVEALVFGDRACYVDLVDEGGQRSTQLATFEICAQDLVGKTVQLTYAPSTVVAAVCNGDLDCGQSDTVLLITQAVVEAPPQRIADLPDGNYRYWSGTSTQAVVPTSELLAEGGALFLFQKQGDRIAGIFSYVDGEAICVQGQVAGNTVAGIAVQTPGDTVLSQTDTFAPFGPATYLAVRRGQAWQGDAVLYNSALLNLNGFNRINAGTVLPPEACL
ncbi:MAG: hypothetical protein VKJ09_09555 [Leptolyngbya sp.]|nr:hypothetical protein [Leptolyngbya sp.]